LLYASDIVRVKQDQSGGCGAECTKAELLKSFGVSQCEMEC